MLYRNWQSIMALDDPEFRRCLILGTQETLAVIQKAAPHLFSEEPTTPWRVPLSLLLRASEEYNQGMEHPWVAESLHRDYNIPTIELVNPETFEAASHQEAVSESFFETLPDKLLCGDPFTYQGKEMIVLNFSSGDFLFLAPSECIDITC